VGLKRDMTDQLVVTTIEQVLLELRPMINRDGGNITLVKVENAIVYVKLHGACVGCPASIYTLKLGIEQAIKERVPTIKEVIPV
jgi:Fe-S cluster biogenesis protein NfuA